MSTNPIARMKPLLSRISAATAGKLRAPWRRVRGAWAGLSPGRRLALACGAVLALGLLLAWLASAADAEPTALAEVVRGPLVIAVTESGVVQNRERVIVKSQVEGTSTILWLVPDGTHVKQGDLLVELDASRFQDDIAEHAIVVMNAEYAHIRARENLAVAQSQGETDVAKADLDLKLAQCDLAMFLEGQYPRDKHKAEADIKLAEEELQRNQEKYDWSVKLAGEGYITSTELKADEAACSKSRTNLTLAVEALELLEKHTYPRTVQKLESDVEQGRRALERATRKASADNLQAEAELKAKESEYARRKTNQVKLEDRVAKCRITAPIDGMVIYATTGRSGRGNEEPLVEGRTVRERQELIYLPTNDNMTAEIKVHESSLRKVSVGQPVRIVVDAVPGRVFWGRVAKIGLLPDAQSFWMNPDLKLYATDIHILDSTDMLRAGMSCRAEIIVEQYPDALQVPVQSVVRLGGQTVVYLPGQRGPTARAVEVGMDNGRYVHVLSGLAEGQSVLLAPPLGASVIAEQDMVEGPASMPAEVAAAPMPPPGPRVTVVGGGPAEPATRPEGRTAELMEKLLAMSSQEARAHVQDLPREEQLALFRGFGDLTPEQQAHLLSPEQLARMRELVARRARGESGAPGTGQSMRGPRGQGGQGAGDTAGGDRAGARP